MKTDSPEGSATHYDQMYGKTFVGDAALTRDDLATKIYMNDYV